MASHAPWQVGGADEETPVLWSGAIQTGSARPAPTGSVRRRTGQVPRDGGGIVSLPDYPPKDYPTRALAEQVVVPGSVPRPPGEPEPNLELILGVRTSRPGVFRTDEVEVTYTVGEGRFVERFPVRITLCAPAATYFARCDSSTQSQS